MQTASLENGVHEMSKPFSGKIRKKYYKDSSAEIFT